HIEAEPRSADELERAAQQIPETLRARHLNCFARRVRVRREIEVMRHPAAAIVLVLHAFAVRLEGVAPRCQRRAGFSPELLVAAAHDPECVVVEAEPDVQAVLLDPLPERSISPACTLAAQPPTERVERD